MNPYYTDDQITLYHGDCLAVLRSDELGYDWSLGYGTRLIPAASVDAVVTDPPYGLEFMGKDWDAPWKPSSVGRGARVAAERAGEMTRQGKGHQTSAGPYLAARVDSTRIAGKPFQDWCQQWAAECLRVLKPGGHLLAFGGTRTWHRLACAIEDAGFEIRDSVAWVYGSGFPKSLDVSKAIDKAAGAEREVLGESRNGASALGSKSRADQGYRPTARDASVSTITATDAAKRWQGWGTALKPSHEPIVVARKPLSGTVAANVLTHGTGALNIDGCRVEATDSQLAEKYASVQNAGARSNSVYGSDTRDRAGAAPNPAGRWPSNVVIDPDTAEEIDRQSGITKDGVAVKRNQTVGSAKSNQVYGRYRNHTDIDEGYGGEGGASRFFPTFRYQAKAPTEERPTANGIGHPTVKPLDLMRWLVRLVTPPGGTVLEPFAGSGTTAEACVHEHMRCIAIEREDDYLPLIVARLSKPMEIGFDFDGEAVG